MLLFPIIMASMSKILELEEWVEASWGLQDRFGIEKALGYVSGEKFCNSNVSLTLV